MKHTQILNYERLLLYFLSEFSTSNVGINKVYSKMHDLLTDGSVMSVVGYNH